MKKIRLATLLLALLLAFSLVPSTNIHAKGLYTVIDGIRYTINEYSNTVTATLADDVTPMKEIHVRSKVNINGISYPVKYFDFSIGFHSYEEWINQVNYKNSRYAVKAGSWQNILEKATFDSGIQFIDFECVNYTNLKEVSFDTTQSSLAFYNCPKLKHVIIGKNARCIPFVQKCPNVKITIDSKNPFFKVIGRDIYSKNGKILYQVSSTKSKYKVRKGVTKIAIGAFQRNDYIKTLFLPDTVKNVQPNAFAQMKNLSHIRLSHAMTESPYDAFSGCPKLKVVTFPSSVKTISGNTIEYIKPCQFKKIYINTKKLNISNMSDIPKSCRIYVKNNNVKKRVRKNGFKGKIIIKR